MPALVASGLSRDAFVDMAAACSRKTETAIARSGGCDDCEPNPISSSHRVVCETMTGPTHLVVVCHGVMGNPSHVEELCKATRQALGPAALVLAPACFAGFGSLRGAEACGDAVFEELCAAVSAHKATLAHVSLMGYSFGGIVARWVCGRLHQRGFLGLDPLNFVTFACPHLGIVDDLGGSRGCGRLLNGAVRFLVRNAGGATGEEMIQEDHGRCLLSWMANPASPFHHGLARFKRRSLYACLRGDRTVSFFTAYFPAFLEDGAPKTDVKNNYGVRDEDGDEGQMMATTFAACSLSVPTPGFVHQAQPTPAGVAFPHVFSWRLRARPTRGSCGAGTSSSFVPASEFDALPWLVVVKVLILFLILAPFLAVWGGVVLPTFSCVRFLVRRLLGGRASPTSFPLGLGPPQLPQLPGTTEATIGGCLCNSLGPPTHPPSHPPHKAQRRDTSRLDASDATNGHVSHASRSAMGEALNALPWEKHVALFSYARDGLGALHTHGPIIARNGLHVSRTGRDVVLHAAISLLNSSAALTVPKTT